MSVKVKCPGCTKTLTVPDAARGKAVKCPSCETRVSIPPEDGGGTEKSSSKPKKVETPATPLDKADAKMQADMVAKVSK